MLSKIVGVCVSVDGLDVGASQSMSGQSLQ